MNISSAYSPVAPVPIEPSRNALPQVQSALIRAVQSLNDSDMFGQENELTFAIDRTAHVVVVRLVNKDTRELVEQIPDGFVLRLAEELNTENAQ
jgi:uncharacterized FlaG/YvyC family protein